MKPEHTSIVRTIFATSDSKYVRDADCDRRFMIVHLNEKKEPVR